MGDLAGRFEAAAEVPQRPPVSSRCWLKTKIAEEAYDTEDLSTVLDVLGRARSGEIQVRVVSQILGVGYDATRRCVQNLCRLCVGGMPKGEWPYE